MTPRAGWLSTPRIPNGLSLIDGVGMLAFAQGTIFRDYLGDDDTE